MAAGDTRAAVRELRKAKGLSQEGLARLLDVSVKTISRYESVSPPTGHALVRFVRMAGEVERHDLFDIFSMAVADEMAAKYGPETMTEESLPQDPVRDKTLVKLVRSLESQWGELQKQALGGSQDLIDEIDLTIKRLRRSVSEGHGARKKPA
jgi:transcriptional regulator with XRE-family HTH domain